MRPYFGHLEALSFIVDLPTRYPQMKVHVLAGNHDLAFATFLGLLPIARGDVPDGWTNDRRASRLCGKITMAVTLTWGCTYRDDVGVERG